MRAYSDAWYTSSIEAAMASPRQQRSERALVRGRPAQLSALAGAAPAKRLNGDGMADAAVVDGSIHVTRACAGAGA
jgi:hypothetical protein